MTKRQLTCEDDSSELSETFVAPKPSNFKKVDLVSSNWRRKAYSEPVTLIPLDLVNLLHQFTKPVVHFDDPEHPGIAIQEKPKHSVVQFNFTVPNIFFCLPDKYLTHTKPITEPVKLSINFVNTSSMHLFDLSLKYHGNDYFYGPNGYWLFSIIMNYDCSLYNNIPTCTSTECKFNIPGEYHTAILATVMTMLCEKSIRLDENSFLILNISKNKISWTINNKLLLTQKITEEFFDGNHYMSIGVGGQEKIIFHLQ